MSLNYTIPYELREKLKKFKITWINGVPTIHYMQAFLSEDCWLLDDALKFYGQFLTPDSIRVSGECLCSVCGDNYYSHKQRHFPFYSEVVDCEGNILHL